MRVALHRRLAAVFIAGILAVALASAQDRLERMQQGFERQTDPVRKARQLPRLGDLQLNVMGTQIQAGEYDAAKETLTAYRENVRSAHEMLRDSGIDAERKPRGFRQVEIHLRSALRTLDEAITRVPFERREEFQDVREEISAIQGEVLKMLFPRRPGRRDDGEPRTEM